MANPNIANEEIDPQVSAEVLKLAEGGASETQVRSRLLSRGLTDEEARKLAPGFLEAAVPRIRRRRWADRGVALSLLLLGVLTLWKAPEYAGKPRGLGVCFCLMSALVFFGLHRVIHDRRD